MYGGGRSRSYLLAPELATERAEKERLQREKALVDTVSKESARAVVEVRGAMARRA